MNRTSSNQGKTDLNNKRVADPTNEPGAERHTATETTTAIERRAEVDEDLAERDSQGDQPDADRTKSGDNPDDANAGTRSVREPEPVGASAG
jgi:hypothetical protein